MNSALLAESYSDFLFTKPPLTFSSIHKTNNSISSLKHKYPNDYPMQKKTILSLTNDGLEGINISVLLEFYRAEGDLKELAKITSFLMESENRTDRIWAELYNLLLGFYNYELYPSQVIDKVMRIQTHSNEMRVFALLVHLHALMRDNMLGPVEKISKHVLLLIEEIDNDYLRHSYKLQLFQFLSSARLLLNRIGECRAISMEMIDLGLHSLYPFCYSNFYHVMAQSYQFTDYDEAVLWLDKAQERLLALTTDWVEPRRQNIQNTRYFIENYWRKNLCRIPEDPSEAAHYHIVIGEINEAIAILDGLYQKNGYFTPFQEFYYAIATKDGKRMKFAKEKFAWNSNHLFFHLFSKEALNIYNFVEEK